MREEETGIAAITGMQASMVAVSCSSMVPIDIVVSVLLLFQRVFNKFYAILYNIFVCTTVVLNIIYSNPFWHKKVS